MSLTCEQRSAIEARGRVLVSASAGAGKTSVMIKRLADIIENGASLDDVLAVTFTKKAAAQMKSRLRSELISRLDCNDEQKRENLRTQLGKINTADISTIDSFCTRLVRTYFYVLKADPAFEVLPDGAEQAALRGRALDEVFDRLYKECDENLYTLLARLRKKRSDASLKEALMDAYDRLRLRPDYMALAQNSYEQTFTEEGFERVCRLYKEHLNKKCRAIVRRVEDFEKGFVPVACGEQYFAVLDEMKDSIEEFISCGDMFDPPKKLSSTAKPKMQGAVKDVPFAVETDDEFKAFTKRIRDKFSDLFKGLKTRGEEREIFIESGKLVRAFIAVLEAFDGEYAALKRDEGKLDYGDLEHFVYELLCGENGDEDIRRQIKDKYKYVFVDEYQDVNPIQDRIISEVAGGDIFCVGDVKQAIYGFRGSSSRFFDNKIKEVAKGDRFIILPDNFRSSEGVIDFVNNLFGGIMTDALCDFNYEDGHAMRGGSRYGSGFKGVAEICTFSDVKDKKQAEGVYSVAERSVSGREFTAEGVAALQLVEEALKSTYFDPDEGVEKKVEPGDICVLTRKRSNKNAQGIVRAITSKYPVAGAAEVNVCDRPEIARILDVLSYVDNSEQDIPLATALLSPLGSFTYAQLAQIRVHGGTGRNAITFRACVAKYRKELKDGIAAKLDEFYKKIDALKTLSGCIGAARLTDEVIRIGGFASEFDSENKLAALRRLQAEAYGPMGELPLSAFLAKIKAGGYKIMAPSSLSSDCVKVMTMHASKGLEFPVVIVADLAAAFKGDDKCEMPFDDELGFAPRYFGMQDRSYSNTLLRRLVVARDKREELKNEINLLYVACTRAKYALHVLCSETEEFDHIRADGASSYADLFDVKAFNPRILPDYCQNAPEKEACGRVLSDELADEEICKKLKAAAEFKYGYELGIELPVKSSASRIISLKGEEENTFKLFEERAEKGSPSATEEGVAYHRFLELCNLNIKDAGGVSAQIAAFVTGGAMTEGQAALINAEGLSKILSMPAFERVRGGEIYREREFICKLPSADFNALRCGKCRDFTVGGDDGNGVIVQGAIDLLSLVRQGDKVIGAEIIDYKYTTHTDERVREDYSPQLALYKSVVSVIYNLDKSKVKTTIVNIRAFRQIDLEL